MYARQLDRIHLPDYNQLEVGRWRCRDPRSRRQTVTARLPLVAEPFARRTHRVSDLARLLAHAAGGRPAERLMARLGLPQSDDTLLRSLKRHAAGHNEKAQVRVVGIDDWARQKGMNYGTILVDLERREGFCQPPRQPLFLGTIIARRLGRGVAKLAHFPRGASQKLLVAAVLARGLTEPPRWRPSTK